MLKIYYYYSFDEESYIFKFYLYEILVVSSIYKGRIKTGNKRKSKKICNIFMKSLIMDSTGRKERKPELNLWDEYLESFLISKSILLKWMDKMIDKYTSYYTIKFLKELKNKIKDKQL